MTWYGPFLTNEEACARCPPERKIRQPRDSYLAWKTRTILAAAARRANQKVEILGRARRLLLRHEANVGADSTRAPLTGREMDRIALALGLTPGAASRDLVRQVLREAGCHPAPGAPRQVRASLVARLPRLEEKEEEGRAERCSGNYVSLAQLRIDAERERGEANMLDRHHPDYAISDPDAGEQGP